MNYNELRDKYSHYIKLHLTNEKKFNLFMKKDIINRDDIIELIKNIKSGYLIFSKNKLDDKIEEIKQENAEEYWDFDNSLGEEFIAVEGRAKFKKKILETYFPYEI